MVNVSYVEGRLTGKRKIEEMTWPEVRAALNAGRTTVIAAAGSMEQHGPHLPIQTDTLLGTFFVEALVERIPNSLQGPTIPFGVSEHHMKFAGTITLDTEAFKTVVRQYAESLASHGFENVVIIPSHGGNFAPLAELAQETGGRIGDTNLILYTDLMSFMVPVVEVASRADISAEVAGAHAGEAETSQVLAAREELAQMNYAVVGYMGDFGPEAAAKIFAEGMTALTDNGILGDARPAERERGFAYRDAMADQLAAWLLERIPG
jgi:creatinine amidohydrolase